jgi:hypothetical protein
MAAHLLSGCLVLLVVPQGAGPDQLREVMSNVENQRLGAGRVADLDLPEDLLRRLSDRILRRSFEDHFRIVIDPRGAAAQQDSAAAIDPAVEAATPERSTFRRVLDVLALAALAVLLFLGLFAWRARSRRKG